ncbi:hypothetical protein [Crossiella cryophila]|uniref:Uncharacterized protein n=1 Tax=Crossiella cryophila TaxID=43355 RepID=A0A7W7CEB2_9PSEU|nr:hypothetical protein [Crossiella cryophila]MBB4679427.1 hypothetical protein [Crossiella cryophila]
MVNHGTASWTYVQELYAPTPGAQVDVHLVRREASEQPGMQDQFPLLCKGCAERPRYRHEIEIQPNFRGRACVGCLRAAMPDVDNPDLVDFYAPALEAAGWQWGVQLAGVVEPSLTLADHPWLTSMTLPRFGASVVVRLPNSWSADRPRALGPERFRFLVPARVAVEWAATDDLNDTSVLEAAHQGGIE